MSAVEQHKDVDQIREDAARGLFNAAVQFVASLDQWADYSNPAHSAAAVAYSRHQKRITLAFLYRLFPDRVADIARITR